MNPFEEVAAAMAKPENKVLYAFMHRAIPTYGLKHEGAVRSILSTDNNKDERILGMITHAWRRSEELEAQAPRDLGELRHEIHNLADAPGKAILIWPPESPKAPPLSPLGALVYPEEGPARYFVLENSIDVVTSEEQPPVLGEWSFLEGNPNPLHGNFGHFGEAGKKPEAREELGKLIKGLNELKKQREADEEKTDENP